MKRIVVKPKRFMKYVAIPLFSLSLIFSGAFTSSNIVKADRNDISSDSLQINPTPQIMKGKSDGFPLTPIVGLIAGKGTDSSAIQKVEKTLTENGVKKIVRNTPGESYPNTPVTILVGTLSSNDGMKEAIQSLSPSFSNNLVSEGYFLSTGKSKKDKKLIILAGKDDAGTYYAAQTFDQLVQKRKGRSWIPSVEIIDWPEMSLRGTIEGFYGPPWSHEDRLNQLEFYGENKFNSYVYAPKDDPYHRDKWRDPYPEDKLNEIKELISKSKENHVNFTFAISPGTSVCYSDDEDFEKLTNKMEVMWGNGVRSFAIFLDDISTSLKCAQDKEMFGNKPNPAAAAQAYLLNRFDNEFIDNHEGAQKLITVPTEYSGVVTSVYKEQFSSLVNDDILVYWTGKEVVSPEITAEETQAVSNIFKQDLLIWDNYPVNDFDRKRLFLGPLDQRDKDIYKHGVVGIHANPMNEAEASKIPLYTIADYSWNPDAYDPSESWKKSIKSFGEKGADTLEIFAENNYSSAIDDNTESLTISPLIKEFQEKYEINKADKVAKKLISEFKKLQQLPDLLQKNIKNEKFLAEIKLHAEKLSIYGKAGEAVVNMLMAFEENDMATVAVQKEIALAEMDKASKINVEVSEGVIPTFLESVFWGPNLALNRQVQVNNYWNNNSSVSGEKAVDGDKSTRWATGGGVKNGWLVVNLPEGTKVNQTLLRECKDFGNRIQSYEIQYWNGTDWISVHKGGIPSEVQKDMFDEIETNKIRLNITSATTEPTVWEFGIYHTNSYE
ncbi:hypothetical protein ASG65_11970 [Bacillus sp. Leaf13]|nr:hypothetical protein ASG65_11970 [Bacillus sp. Leaf13]